MLLSIFDNLWTIAAAAATGVSILGLALFFISRYKRCPANQILVISGKVGDGKSARCISGGGAFIWPVLQEYDFLDLTPMPMDIDLKDALSLENIRVAIPATVTVAISRDPNEQGNAAVRLLGLDYKGITALAQDIILGQMRQVIASMTIEEINRDRDMFLKKIDDSLEPELKKIGLIPLNVNIRDIKDSSGYIEATGKKAAAQAVNQALADVAEQEKTGQIKVSQAHQVQEIQVAEANRTKEIGVQAAAKDTAIQVAEFNKERAINVARAEAQAAQGQADAAVEKAEAFQRAETAKAEAEAAVDAARNTAQTAAAKANALRVEAEARSQLEAVAKAEAAKLIVEAQAEAQQKVLAAEAEAKAIYAKLKAEADGQLAIANAKAEGIKNMVSAAGGAESAFKLLMVDNMKHIADASASAISNIKFDKVVVWGGQGGTEVPDFISGLAKVVPPLMETMKEIGGVDIPKMLKSGTE